MTETQPLRYPAQHTHHLSASKQLPVQPDDVANKLVGPDEVACNGVGTAGGLPQALAPHPCAKVGEPTLEQFLEGPGRVETENSRFSVRLMPATNSLPGTREGLLFMVPAVGSAAHVCGQ